MKIFIACSKHFYDRVSEIKRQLETQGHQITVPNCFEEPFKEDRLKELNPKEHIKFKSSMMKLHEPKISENDALLVLNYEKYGQSNYIGGATFMEIVKAWELGKKIFLLNPIPSNIFEDELRGINPIILDGDLSRIQDKKIEVEIRSFITKEKYEELLEFFNQKAEFVKEDFQETFYFDETSNLRIQRGNNSAKLWHKSGNVHDEFMEEIEIKTKREYFENLEKFLNKLGHDVKIKWFRKRKQFNWDGIKVCLDYTKSYGYIIELEKIGTEDNKNQILKELKQKLNELGIPLTPREEFERKYNYYKENWRKLIENDMD